ncbi:hypothetical protein CIG75_12685 [Tumebacillus algifaecis]|uniref:Uncharacterized protein n=1 Tax=Tumebacillus algifaecis TaxID=1214604 RepID=A0A223D2N9_9BACL|nr:hypothetical protein [Tumebacillus algifaecis]ASS75755.1 hypothetical protein CIG75_12685 [Tumebacillus algifaecis]
MSSGFNKRDEKVSVESLSFWSLVRLMEFGNFFKLSFLISLVVSLLTLAVVRELPEGSLEDVSKYIGNVCAPISGTLLGIVIAGLAILTALSNGGLMQVLLKRKLLQRLLIPFWLISCFWALTLGSAIILYILSWILPLEITRWYIIGYSFLFTYSLCLTVSLVGGTIQVGVLAAEFPTDGNDTGYSE